ncbi:MAG: tRNA glutamyl-Q(34) synthetase GluQRS [Pseudomonadota bacterium]
MTTKAPSAERRYVGRFAPSPTGHLHFGSLVTALASFLQARSRGGRWLMRMEDIDPPRIIKGSAELILKTLVQHGLEWDDQVMNQSTRRGAYDQALERLRSMDALFPCTCSRRSLGPIKNYPGICRNRPFPETLEHAVRVRCEGELEYTDGLLGLQRVDLAKSGGDFIVLRRDFCIAYQLACVVDDHDQGVTEVLRGADLLESTPRQIYLFKKLGWKSPQYCHVPLALDTSGEKLGKSTGAPAMHLRPVGENLIDALIFLRQDPPKTLQHESLEKILEWAVKHWNLRALNQSRNDDIDS